MAHLSISKAWDETVAFVGKEGRLLFPVAFVFLALPSVVVGQIVPQTDLSGAKTIAEMAALLAPDLPRFAAGFAISSLIGLFGSLTLYALALRPGISVGEAIRLALNRFFPALAASVLTTLAWGCLLATPLLLGEAGAIPAALLAGLLMLPLTLFLVVRLILVNAVIVAEASGPLPAIARSWLLTAGQFGKLFGFFVVAGIVMTIASIAASAVFGIVDALIGETSGEGVLSLLASAIVSTVFNVYVLVMIGRLYRQLSAG